MTIPQDIEVVRWDDVDNPPIGCCRDHDVSLALGVFDGVHLGHQELLRRAVRDAEGLANARPAVLTFDPNPARVTRPDSHPGDLTTISQRLQLFAESGIHIAVVVSFTEAFAALPGHRFLEALRIIFPRLALVVVGFNFHLGRGRDVDTEELTRWMEGHGVRVDIVPALQDNRGSISSSRIRRAVATGDLGLAAALLGRPYSLALDGILPSRRSDCRLLLPPRGSYRCRFLGDGVDAIGRLEIDDDGTLEWMPPVKDMWYVTLS